MLFQKQAKKNRVLGIQCCPEAVIELKIVTKSAVKLANRVHNNM